MYTCIMTGESDRCNFCGYKLLRKMRQEAPEEIFTVLIFATNPGVAQHQLAGLLKPSAVFIYVVVGSSAKTANVCTM